jgi:hypothetical protein
MLQLRRHRIFELEKRYYNQDNPHSLSARGTTLSTGQKLSIRFSGTALYTGQHSVVELVVSYCKEYNRMLGYRQDPSDRTTLHCLFHGTIIWPGQTFDILSQR